MSKIIYLIYTILSSIFLIYHNIFVLNFHTCHGISFSLGETITYIITFENFPLIIVDPLKNCIKDMSYLLKRITKWKIKNIIIE